MAKIVIPTREGFDVVEQTSETKNEREWKFVFPNSFSDTDTPFTLHKLARTGETIRNLELVCVEPITSSSPLNQIEQFYDVSVSEVYKQIMAMAEKKDLPFVALSEGHILCGRPRGFEKFVYLSQFYRNGLTRETN